MKYTIESRIEIEAPISQVWQTFRDFENHKEWNTFLAIHHDGMTLNKPFIVDFLKDGKVNLSMKPILVKDEAPTSFEWVGHLFINGLFDGHHQFHFVDLGNNRTELIHFENFKGLLIRLLKKSVIEPTKLEFDKFNKDLKDYVENSGK
jgi:hypothetical protein